MTHSPECQKQMDDQKKNLEAWLEKWPDHCDNCRGWGGKSFPGNCEEPPDFDPCDECTGKGLCGRCKGLLSNDEEGPCLVCGWNYDDGVPYDDGWICCGECMMPDPEFEQVEEEKN